MNYIYIYIYIYIDYVSVICIAYPVSTSVLVSVLVFKGILALFYFFVHRAMLYNELFF